MEPILIMLALFGGLATILGGFVAAKAGDKLRHGLLPYYLYFLLFAIAELISRSNRNLDTFGELGAAGTEGAAGWLIRASSLVGIVAVLVVLYRRVLGRSGQLTFNQKLVFLSFALFWVTSYLIPLGFAPNSELGGLKMFYLPLIFSAALLALPQDALASIRHARWAILFFIALCYVGALFKPETAFFFSYADTQGYLPGVPRFYGLAPHALGLGALTVAAIWLFIELPAGNRWLQYFIMVVLWVTLILTQAKTSAFSCVLGCLVLFIGRKKMPSFNTVATSSAPAKYIYAGALAALMAVVSAAALAIAMGSFDTKLAQFENSEAGARITSLTGRAEIWDAAISEWRKEPIFGYGNQAFSRLHAVQLGLPHANNAHNQYYDMLVRSGIVGFTGLVVYLLSLIFVAIRTKSSMGLFLVVLIFGTLARTITDLPFSASGSVGFDNIHQFLIHLVVAACVSSDRSERSAA